MMCSGNKYLLEITPQWKQEQITYYSNLRDATEKWQTEEANVLLNLLLLLLLFV